MGQTRDAAKHSTMHRTTSHNKDFLAQDVNSVEVEKPWSRESGSKRVRKNRERKIKKL